ncbi:Techylectin-5B [Amphibalanus amphitrite]|uniref:Techylectin-5B n=1 Tax=Amphibalanus amphitrite TaxID=1232801 RepID=A0A6A4W3Y0_AMPAM|nr:techylectin-5B-like [Amphibalanus amphitrite]KAF0296551.1 Techylectin-5B [Amphibalanus amphitrite]
MWLLAWLLLVEGLAAERVGAHDIPLESGLGAVPESSAALSDRLQRMDERLIQLAARLESLTHTVDTQLAQLDNSVLQLYRELGSGRLTEAAAELRGLLQEARVAPADPQLVSTLSQEIRQSEQLLQAQLNDTQQRLVTLLQEGRPAAASPATTTVIVERCSFPDQFQRTDGWRPADCAAVQQRHQRSGVYTIYPPVCGNGGGIRVYCDMDTDGGGWTVLLRRADLPDHQDFDLGWDSYKWGFGNLSAEFWLGNEYMSLLTSMEQMQLRVDLKDWGNASATASYTPFSIGSEQQKYALKVGKYEGNAGDALTYYNTMAFTTKDRDNDKWSKNCAQHYQHAWWNKSCLHSTLTGPYKKGALKSSWAGVTWKQWKGDRYSLKHVELKMRPVNYMTWCHKLAQEGVSE